MGTFSHSSKKRVTGHDYKEVRSRLRSKGFSDPALRDVDNLFHGHMEESGDESGVDEKELKKSIGYLKEHTNRHGLSEDQIGMVDEEMRREM